MGRVFDTRKHSNVKKHAAYRQVNRYYKSVDKLKAEQLRRRQVLEMHGEGLANGVVASRLGVHVRTVQRDLKKLHPVIKGEENRCIRSVEDEAYQWAASAGLGRVAEYVGGLSRVAAGARRGNSFRLLLVGVDVDAAFAGRYPVSFWPDLPLNLVDNSRVVFTLRACGRAFDSACLYAAVAPGSLSLHTNLSMGSYEKPTLQGLRVVDPANSQPCGDPASVSSRRFIEIQRRLLTALDPWQVDEFRSLGALERAELLGQFEGLLGGQKRAVACRALTVTLDVDAAFNGCYAARFQPRLPVSIDKVGRITLKLSAAGRTQFLESIHVSDITHGMANLSTHRHHDPSTYTALQGLSIVDPANP